MTRSTLIALTVVALLWALLASVQPTHAAGVVGTATPASCTETAFVAALSGGGSVTFDCGANPTPISITLGFRDINQNTSIDGGGLITLDANHNSNIFQVNAGQALTLTAITLTNGHANPAYSPFGGGCIYVDHSTLLLVNAAVISCTVNSNYNGGGIASLIGAVTLINSSLSGNSASDGAGIDDDGGTTTLTNSILSGNSATNSGGGIYNYEAATLNLTQSTLSGNIAGNEGGELYHSKFKKPTGWHLRPSVEQAVQIDRRGRR